MVNSIEQEIAREFVDEMEECLEQFIKRGIGPSWPNDEHLLLAPLGFASSSTMAFVQEGR